MLSLLVTLNILAAVTTSICSPAKASPQGDSSITDITRIFSVAAVVDQKSGSKATDPPGLPAPNPFLTALDGHLLSQGSPESHIPSVVLSSTRQAARRAYTQMFDGNGTGIDAAVIGTAYLTYTVVPNSTYNVEACLDFCDSVPGCKFVNLYYEFNNYLLDDVFKEKSNLKCAAFADYHTAHEKTNYGGQPLESHDNLTYIEHSSGYAVNSTVQPITPARYRQQFGPVNTANIAGGYMGFAFVDRYDVNACAQLCNLRENDAVGGRCKFFNIWRAEVNKATTTYTCSMYYLETDASTATYAGQGNLDVKDSRGYTLSDIQ
ncbi:hypothetical protein BDQ17DRAFT_1288875 [Cyathus striatus]|nr:hypothetical protein BDQ17DRAFT_1288875 [Cyathus striatus]